jgi:hypothetical protein
MNKEKKVLLIIISIIILSFTSITTLKIITENQELKSGKPAEEFCKSKCHPHQIITSNNNSKYNFIRCECLIKAKTEASTGGIKTNLETRIYYYNATTESEINSSSIHLK